MQKYFDIIRIDLMTMNGDKNSLRSLTVLIFLGSIAGEILLSPMFGFIGMLMVGAMSVPMVFTSHSKYHSEKMFGLLPIKREELVTARFMLFTAFYLAMSIVMYIFMEVSLALNISAEITGDFEKILADTGIGIPYANLCRLLFFLFFAFGMTAVVTSLKGYFADPTSFEALTGIGTSVKKMDPRQMILAILIFTAVMLFFLFASGAIPMSAAAAVILQLIIQIFTAADGVLFSAVMMILAAFSAIYNYICTVLEYDDKDL